MGIQGFGEFLEKAERWLGPVAVKWLARLIALTIAIWCANLIGSLFGWPLLHLVRAMPGGLGAMAPYFGDVLSGLISAFGSAWLFYWLTGIRTKRNRARAEAMIEEVRQMKYDIFAKAGHIEDMVPHILSRTEQTIELAEQAIAQVSAAATKEKSE